MAAACDGESPDADAGPPDASEPGVDGGAATDAGGGEGDAGGAGEDGGSSEPDAGPTGLTSADGIVTLSIPDGALPDGLSIDDIQIVVDDTPSAFLLNATAEEILGGSADLTDHAPPALSYSLQPAGTVFDAPITATFRLPTGMLDGGGYFTLTSGGEVEDLAISDVRAPEEGVREVDVEVPHFSNLEAWGVGDNQARLRLLSPAEGTVFLVGTTFEDRLEVSRPAGAESSFLSYDDITEEEHGVYIHRVLPGAWSAYVGGFVYFAVNPMDPDVGDLPGGGRRTSSGPPITTGHGPIECLREGPGRRYMQTRPTATRERIFIPYEGDGLGSPMPLPNREQELFMEIRPEIHCQDDLGCGDGTAVGAEECDGADLRGQTCAMMGLLGTLSCAQDCRYTGCIEGTSVGARDAVTGPEAICSLPEGFPGGTAEPGVCVAGSGGVQIQGLDGTVRFEGGGAYYETAALSARTADGGVVDQLWNVGSNGGFILYYDPFVSDFGEFGLTFSIGQNLTDISPIPHPTEAGRTSGALLVNNSTGELFDISFDGSDFVRAETPIVSAATLTEATGSMVSAVRRDVDHVLIVTDGDPGHLFVYDQANSTATLVGTVGAAPRRVRCADAGTPCAVTSFGDGMVTVYDWAVPEVLPTVRGTVSVSGAVFVDFVPRPDGAHSLLSGGSGDGTVHYTVVPDGGGALEDHSETLTDCASPTGVAWLGDDPSDGAAVSCNGSDTWRLLHPPAAVR